MPQSKTQKVTAMMADKLCSWRGFSQHCTELCSFEFWPSTFDKSEQDLRRSGWLISGQGRERYCSWV